MIGRAFFNQPWLSKSPKRILSDSFFLTSSYPDFLILNPWGCAKEKISAMPSVSVEAKSASQPDYVSTLMPLPAFDSIHAPQHFACEMLSFQWRDLVIIPRFTMSFAERTAKRRTKIRNGCAVISTVMAHVHRIMQRQAGRAQVAITKLTHCVISLTV